MNDVRVAIVLLVFYAWNVTLVLLWACVNCCLCQPKSVPLRKVLPSSLPSSERLALLASFRGSTLNVLDVSNFLHMVVEIHGAPMVWAANVFQRIIT